MENLKLRVWDNIKNTMYPVHGIDFLNPATVNFNGESQPYQLAPTLGIIANCDIIVMVSTYKYDNKGNEIWEDDILEESYCDRWHISYRPYKGQWYGCYVGPESPKDRARGHQVKELSEISPCLVIGNRWENPELIFNHKKKKGFP